MDGIERKLSEAERRLGPADEDDGYDLSIYNDDEIAALVRIADNLDQHGGELSLEDEQELVAIGAEIDRRRAHELTP